MQVRGFFDSADGKHYEVIYRDASGTTSGTQLDTSMKALSLGATPVVIKTNRTDLTKSLYISQCEVQLLTRNDLSPILFTKDYDGVECIVNCVTDNKTVFSGYLIPQVYNQNFSHLTDSLKLTANDRLGSLQYVRYKDTTYSNYRSKSQTAAPITFKAILTDIANRFLGGASNVIYDGSVGINHNRLNRVFEDIMIPESVIYGDSYDSTMYYSALFEEMLKYLNLKAQQIGDKIYIYNLNSIRNRRNYWYDLDGNGVTVAVPTYGLFTSAMHSKDDTQLTVDEAYNLIYCKPSLKKLTTVIPNPLEKDKLRSYYRKQPYCVDYVVPGLEVQSKVAAWNFCLSGTTDWDEDEPAVMYNYFVQEQHNDEWDFFVYPNGVQTEISSLCPHTSGGTYYNQTNPIIALQNNQIGAGLFSFGMYKTMFGDGYPNEGEKDPLNLEMTPYLCIGVHGNQDDNSATTTPTENTFRTHSPLAVYDCDGGQYSPVDDNVTNYLLFTGDISLQPKIEISQTRRSVLDSQREPYQLYDFVKNGVELPYQDRMGLNVRDWLQFYTPDASATSVNVSGITPPIDMDNEDLEYIEYNYSANWDEHDEYLKLKVLECYLQIGNKMLVEIPEEGQSGIYGKSRFEWRNINDPVTVTYDGQTYELSTFTLGFNPKVGNNLITGKFLPLQDTRDPEYELSTAGTVIKMTKADNLTGALHFEIRGVVNTLFDEVIRRHPSFWRHTRWAHNDKPVMSWVDMIYIKNFECKFASSATDTTDTATREFMYMSIEDAFTENRKSISLNKFCTQPDIETFAMAGSDYYNITNAVMLTNGEPLKILFNEADQEEDTPEKLIVNHYYNLLHNQKEELTGTFHMNPFQWRDIKQSKVLGWKDFYPVDYQWDVLRNNSKVKFREK